MKTRHLIFAATSGLAMVFSATLMAQPAMGPGRGMGPGSGMGMGGGMMGFGSVQAPPDNPVTAEKWRWASSCISTRACRKTTP